MARAAKKKTPTRAAPRRAPPKPKKPGTTDTREVLIAEMSAVLDEVDAMLPTLASVQWHAHGYGPLAKLRAREEKLNERMWELMDPDEDARPDDVFGPALAMPGGTVPTPARAGTWVEWIAYVPIVVHWPGFLGHDPSYTAGDPAERWITSSGYQSTYLRIESGDFNLREAIRAQLSAMTRDKNFNLHELTVAARDRLVERLAENEWLRAALDAGPVDPIPLPPKLQAVQQSLFA